MGSDTTDNRNRKKGKKKNGGAKRGFVIIMLNLLVMAVVAVQSNFIKLYTLIIIVAFVIFVGLLFFAVLKYLLSDLFMLLPLRCGVTQSQLSLISFASCTIS